MKRMFPIAIAALAAVFTMLAGCGGDLFKPTKAAQEAQQKNRPIMNLAALDDTTMLLIPDVAISFRQDEIHKILPTTQKIKAALHSAKLDERLKMDAIWIQVTGVPSETKEVRDEGGRLVGYQIILTDLLSGDKLQAVSGDMVMGYRKSAISGQEIINKDYLRLFRRLFYAAQQAAAEKQSITLFGIFCAECDGQLAMIPNKIFKDTWSYTFSIAPDHDQLF